MHLVSSPILNMSIKAGLGLSPSCSHLSNNWQSIPGKDVKSTKIIIVNYDVELLDVGFVKVIAMYADLLSNE